MMKSSLRKNGVEFTMNYSNRLMNVITIFVLMIKHCHCARVGSMEISVRDPKTLTFPHCVLDGRSIQCFIDMCPYWDKYGKQKGVERYIIHFMDLKCDN